jgi:hypothetical protein
MNKLDYTDFEKMVADPDVSDAEISRYLTARLDVPFNDRIIPDQARILMKPEERVEILGIKKWANKFCRKRRQERFRRRVRNGEKKPILVSEGDSWFQFPFLIEDVIDQLEPDFLIWSLDAAGDTADNMINRHPEYMTELRDQQKKHKVSGFLFSAAGNDVIGDINGKPALLGLLNPYQAGKDAAWHIHKNNLKQVLDTLERNYKKVISTIRGDHAFAKLPMFFHSYAYAIPGGFKGDYRWPIYAKQNEWLGGPMKSKGIIDTQLQRDIIRLLINALHDMLESLAGKSSTTNIHVVDVRNKLPNVTDWADEIHATSKGFKTVGKTFKKIIDGAI